MKDAPGGAPTPRQTADPSTGSGGVPARANISTTEFHVYEADVVAGIEPIARAEIERLGARDLKLHPGAIQFSLGHELRRLLNLRTVLSVYRVQHFNVPRPKALLGDQHLRALLTQIDAVRALMPSNAYRTFMLAAAGSDSTVMTRLKAEIARHTHLHEANEGGDLLIRIRPTPTFSASGTGGQVGWDVLVRLSPRPLATRDWRVCKVPGSLQATVAHAMALLTQPRPDDVYLNLGCGSGTLLIERAMTGRAQRLIGCDTDPQALACARENIAAFGRVSTGSEGDRIGRPYNMKYEIYDCDARALPLPDASVDALTADLPFGNRVGSHQDNTTLYPALLHEAARVARPRARCVTMTADVRLMEATLESAGEVWQRERSFRVNLGGLQPAIFVLRRV